MSEVFVGEIVTLSDGKSYLVTYDVDVDGVRYLYMISVEEPRVVRFAKQNEDGLELIFNKEEKNKVAKALSEIIEKDLPLEDNGKNE